MGTASAPGGPNKIGLALAGGGPEGAIYELGAVRALQEALDGLDFNDLHVYVGVSAGAFISACLANGLTPGQLVRGVVRSDPGAQPFSPRTFFTPAVGEFVSRGLNTPWLLAEGLWDYVNHPLDRSLLGIAARLARALPVGLFDNKPIRDYLERVFDHEDRTDDFRRLAHRLVVVAADLDSGKAALFGEPGLDHVPISVAVQASIALPGLYPPVPIGDRYYVDGVLLKTLHGSVAIDAGAELLFCVNPIVPVDTERAIGEGVMRRGKLVHRGLPTVLAQTFRTLVRSRLSAGMAAYIDRYPDTDVVLIEPRRDDYRMFFTNVFRFSSRRSVCEHAYRATLEDLARRRDELEPVLARHGIRLRHEVINDPERDMWTSLGGGRPASRAALAERLHRTLARLDAVLEERGSSG